MQELCLFLCTVGWWRKALLRGHGSMVGREVLSWGRADFCRGTRIGEWESEWGVIVPRDIQAWSPSPREVETLETFCDRDDLSPSLLWGRMLFEKFLYYEWSLIYWYFVWFFVFWGVSSVKEDKEKIDWISWTKL